jgi:anaerobic magnesium-protoporphyrin IX monomethyl ester cyclase
LAGSLRAAGHDVRVMDCHEVTSWDKDTEVLTVHRDKLPECDVLGVSATSANVSWGSQMAAVWPARYKIIGGTHVTYLLNGPHERFKQKKYFANFDYLMSDESEESFVAFCDSVTRGVEPKHQFIPPIPNLAWFDSSGKLHRNPHGPSPEVTKLPAPAFDLWESPFFGGAFSSNGSNGSKKMNLNDAMTASMYNARGCPYGCTFCADARSKLREETLDQIRGQAAALASMGISCVRLQEDTFTIREQRARDISDILHDHNFLWRANTRVNLKNPALFRYMADHGCSELGFGVESGSNRILKLMNKGTTAEANEMGIKACQDAGIIAKAFLMIGFPGDDLESIEETRKWVERVKPDMVSFALFQPYPGSAVFNYPDRFGVTIPDDAFDRFWQQGLEGTEREVVLELSTIKTKDLVKARIELGQWLDSYVGHRDRTRVDSGGLGGMGTFSPYTDPSPSMTA